ncbi:MAG: hypothetical protein ACSLFR_14135 [Solirubrobacteraceae bacterium]
MNEKQATDVTTPSSAVDVFDGDELGPWTKMPAAVSAVLNPTEERVWRVLLGARFGSRRSGSVRLSTRHIAERACLSRSTVQHALDAVEGRELPCGVAGAAAVEVRAARVGGELVTRFKPAGQAHGAAAPET